MSGFKLEQRRLQVRGREFHFVSYEGQDANPARKQEAMPPTWFLINSGKRWAVMPHQPEQDTNELEQQLTTWLESNVFA